MTRKTDLPAPLEDPALPQRQPSPETARLVSVYLRTLSSSQTIKTYNTEIFMFVSYLEGELGKGLGS